MVERINKPETQPPYRVLPTKETKDGQSQKQDEDQEDGSFQSSVASSDWEKFQGSTMTVRAVKVSKQRIKLLLFKRAILKSGVCVVEVEVLWKDGRRTPSALIMLPKREDFMKLKSFTKGKMFPEIFWPQGSEMQMGIIESGSITGSWNVKEKASNQTSDQPEKGFKKNSFFLKFFGALGLVDKEKSKIKWFSLTMYVLGLFVIFMIVYYIIKI